MSNNRCLKSTVWGMDHEDKNRLQITLSPSDGSNKTRYREWNLFATS